MKQRKTARLINSLRINELIEEKLDKIKDWKLANKEQLVIGSKLFEEADKAILKVTCKKELVACEPEFCEYWIDNSCKYSEQLAKLNELRTGL